MPANRPNRRNAVDEACRQRDQELRRARGEIACVECQRLKLKCDRKVPCSSCKRRNRAVMCPNGHAWSDQETRSLLSDTAQLHRKLKEMSQRIRQLEDALEISHSTNSSNPHPLLREELLSIKRGVAPPASIAPEPEVETTEADYVDAMGTMSISEHGVSRFIGRTGGGESLIFLANGAPTQRKNFQEKLFPQILARRSDIWLLMPPNSSREDVLSIIESHMPSFMRASSLCETFLENFSWLILAVERPQIFEELLPICYRLGGGVGINDAPQLQPDVNAHELAVLLIVFATGALSDLTIPPYNDEAERYYQLALAALNLEGVLGSATLAAVQAFTLMAAYNCHCGRNSTLDLAGSFFNLAASASISMGLHRDAAKWNVSSKLVNRRRRVFWELFTYDGWHNIANGKPSSFHLRYCDCKYPNQDSQVVTEDGCTEPDYWADRQEFSRLCYAVNDLFSGVQPIRYSQILELDRKVTEHIIPSHLQIPPEGSNMEMDGPLLIMQRIVPVVCQNGLLIYIHRGYFAKALLDYPHDPTMSPYAHSYLSAYRSALAMLKVVRDHYIAFPNLISRFWSFWSHAFSATVIIGSIVIKSKDVDTVRAALVELNLAVGLFEKAALQSERAKRSLPILLRMRDKAYIATKFLNDPPPAASADKAGVENVDELLIFAGKNKLVKEECQEISLSSHDMAASPIASGISSSTTHVSNSATAGYPRTTQHIQSMPLRQDSCSSEARVPPIPDANIHVLSSDLPSAWSTWSDQEALLINYLSSGADLNMAQTATLSGEADPSGFLWAEMSHTGSPDSRSSSTGNDSAQHATLSPALAQQADPDIKPMLNVSDTNGIGYSTIHLATHGQDQSMYVRGSEIGMMLPLPQQNQFPAYMASIPWDTFY